MKVLNDSEQWGRRGGWSEEKNDRDREVGRKRERGEKITRQELGVRKDSQWGLQSMRIRTDDLEVTELQEGPVRKGRTRQIGKKGGRGRIWVKKNHTLDSLLHWTPKNTQLKCA